MIGTSFSSSIILWTAAVAPERIDRAALVVPAGFGTGLLVSMMRVGLPAILYWFLESGWLLERILTEMVTQPDPDPVVRETIAIAFLTWVTLD